MKQVKVRFEAIEVKDGSLAIIYIPDQTQILQAGKRYEIVIERNGKGSSVLRENDRGRA